VRGIASLVVEVAADDRGVQIKGREFHERPNFRISGSDLRDAVAEFLSCDFRDGVSDMLDSVWLFLRDDSIDNVERIGGAGDFPDGVWTIRASPDLSDPVARFSPEDSSDSVARISLSGNAR
jgi:hypothetical protein